MAVSVDATLGDLVAADPGVAAVLDRLGLDFCRHGDRTLASACDEVGLDADAVVAELAVASRSEAVGWSDLGPAALAEHIVATHHRHLHDELPLIDGLADKVLGVHGDRHPELRGVRSIVGRLRVELPPHLDAEETDLFPAIATLGSSVGSRAVAAAQVRDLAVDHDEVAVFSLTCVATPTGTGCQPTAASAFVCSTSAWPPSKPTHTSTCTRRTTPCSRPSVRSSTMPERRDGADRLTP